MPTKSITEFTWYSFRADYVLDTFKQELQTWLDGYYLKHNYKLEWVLFDEVSSVVGKKHIQGKIGVALSSIQFVKHIRQQFPHLVKSHFSCADIKDLEKYDSYIAKDGVLFSQNTEVPFTQEYIQQQKEKHLQMTDAFEKKKQKQTDTFTQRVFREFIKEYPYETQVISQYAYKYSLTDSETKEYNICCKKLLGLLLKKLGLIVKVFDDNQLQKMYNSVKTAIIQSSDSFQDKTRQLDYYSARIEF